MEDLNNSNSFKNYFKRNQGLFYGVIITILILLIGKYLLFQDCCPQEKTSNPPLPITCAPEGTRIELSGSNLTVTCSGGINCFEQFNDKLRVISHEAYYNDLATGQKEEDPLYVGNRICDPATSGLDCNEPPIGFMVPSGSNKGFNFSSGGAFSNILEVNSEDPLLQYNPCEFDGFLTICLLEENYNDMLSDYLGSCPNLIGKCVGPRIPPTPLKPIVDCFDFSGFPGFPDFPDGKWFDDYPYDAFTIQSRHETEIFYVTILETGILNRVFRIAYKNPAELEDLFIFP